MMADTQVSAGRQHARQAILLSSRWDVVLITLAVAHGVVLAVAPTIPVIVLGLWWNSNTISHNFIHRPFFRHRGANVIFAAYLSLLLGIPQLVWRDRHFAHHAGVRPRARLNCELLSQISIVLMLWAVLAVRAPSFFLGVYVPGYVAGLGLCAVHGYYEHARGTTSYYGKLYNLIFFNDGYHVEHHSRPGLHWTRLPEYRASAMPTSKWPAPLRWMEACSLETLERVVLKSRILQRFVLATHARAFRRFQQIFTGAGNVAVVGGGLFPRTALILGKLLPDARITIIDANAANLERARMSLDKHDIEFVNKLYSDVRLAQYDLVVIPLSFNGDRREVYAHPPAPVTIIHDWIWHKRGDGGIVSITLFKRINVIRQ